MAVSLELRVLRAEDGPALEAELVAARARADLRASSDPELTFSLQVFAVSPDWFGGAFVGGELVGFVLPDLKVVVVRQEHRRHGIGRELVELGLAISAAHGRRELFLGSVPEAPGGAAFLQATGFTPHSTVWNLELAPDRAVPEPAWPEGIVVRAFDRKRDVSALPAVVNVAFADHPTPIVMEEEMIGASLDDPNILDEDVILLEEAATGELLGFCMCDVRRIDGAVSSRHGEIGMIGVRPDRQRRGLGRQLLRAGARYLRSVGAPNVELAVNGRNESALGLYESEGFQRTRTRDRWVRPAPEAGS